MENEYEKIFEDSKKATDLDPKNRNIVKHIISHIIEKTEKGFTPSNSMMQPIYMYMEELGFDSAQISFWFGSDAEGIVREIQNKYQSDSFRSILEQHQFDTSYKNRENYNAYQDVYIKANNVVSHLKVDDEKDYGVSHYTKKSTAKTLLEKSSKFWLSPISGANDPKEGETLIDYLSDNTSKLEQNSNNERQAFIACFTFNHNHLNQFRLYGKENGNECTGLSLVLKNNYFANQEFLIDHVNKQHTLYRCVYIDPKSHNIISVGQREEYTFYSKGRYSEYEKEEKYKPYKEKIIEVMEKTRIAFSELERVIENIKTKDWFLIQKLLINLRYLIKHSAFKEEQECRIIHLADRKDGNLKNIEETNIRCYVKKIFFGPACAADETCSFQKTLEENGLGKIVCEESGLPYRIPSTGINF